MLSVKQKDIKYHFFKSLVWLNLWLNPGLPGHRRTLYPINNNNDHDEIKKRTRKLPETILYSMNLIKGINTWADVLIGYSEQFLKWTREELVQMNKRTRKPHKALHTGWWCWQTICVKKRWRKKTCQLWRQRWCTETTTRKLQRKIWRKIDTSHQILATWGPADRI